MADIKEFMAEHASSPFDSWTTYLEDSNYSEGTRKLYVRHLQEFCNWFDVPPDELLDLQVQAIQSGDPRALAIIPRKVNEYIGHQIKNMGRHSNTADTTKKAVKNFFTSNHVPLEFLRTKKIRPKGVALISHNEALRLYEEIALTHRPPEKIKALIMVLKDTGLRVSEVSAMTVEDFHEADKHYENGEEFRSFADSYFIGKSGSWGWPHFGPESIEVVNKYIGERRHGSLFLDRNGEPTTGINITTVMRRACAKLKSGRKLSAHSFRKFFQTELERADMPKRAGMPKNWIAKLQGREIGDSTAAYSKPEEGHVEVNGHAYVPGTNRTYLTQSFIDNYDALRILTKPEDEKTREEYEAQKLEIKDLLERVNNLEIEARAAEHGMGFALDRLAAHGLSSSENDPIHDSFDFRLGIANLVIEAVKMYQKDPKVGEEKLRQAVEQVRGLASPEARASDEG